MLSLISGYYVIRAAMLGVGLGSVLVWGVVEAQAMEAEDDFLAPKLALLTTRFIDSRADVVANYRLGASAVSARIADALPFGPGRGNSFQLSVAAEVQQESARMYAPWRQANDEGPSSPRNPLRLEFRQDPVKIAFRRHSVSIEGERLKLQLTSDLVSMLWRQAF